MKRDNRRLMEATSHLRAMATSGALERDVAESFVRALRLLEQAVRSGRKEAVRRRIDELARLFLKVK